MYMKNWNETVELVEKFAEDIMSYICIDEVDDYDELFEMLTRDIYIYTLMVVRHFSL